MPADFRRARLPAGKLPHPAEHLPFGPARQQHLVRSQDYRGRDVDSAECEPLRPHRQPVLDPAFLDSHSEAIGHFAHNGRRGRQTSCPRSISAWKNAPGALAPRATMKIFRQIPLGARIPDPAPVGVRSARGSAARSRPAQPRARRWRSRRSRPRYIARRREASPTPPRFPGTVRQLRRQSAWRPGADSGRASNSQALPKLSTRICISARARSFTREIFLKIAGNMG